METRIILGVLVRLLGRVVWNHFDLRNQSSQVETLTLGAISEMGNRENTGNVIVVIVVLRDIDVIFFFFQKNKIVRTGDIQSEKKTYFFHFLKRFSCCATAVLEKITALRYSQEK